MALYKNLPIDNWKNATYWKITELRFSRQSTPFVAITLSGWETEEDRISNSTPTVTLTPFVVEVPNLEEVLSDTSVNSIQKAYGLIKTHPGWMDAEDRLD